MRVRRRLLALASAGAMTAALAGCGNDGGDETGGAPPAGTDTETSSPTDTGPGPSEDVILGTTDVVTSLDPAGAYDLASWTLQYNMYQTLVTIPAGGNTPEGDAAEECSYETPSRYTCTLRDGLKFSNGNDLTSSDVKFSMDRMVQIANPNGPSGLFASLKNVETPDDTTVVFNLKQPDTTFQYVLTTAAASIVDEDVFPADKLLDDTEAVGSGPYMMTDYRPGELAGLEANPEYAGQNTPQAQTFLVQYFKEASTLKQAVEGGDVDVAWRSLSPTDIADLKESDSVEVVEGEGSEIRYFVWQFNTDVGGNEAIRQAVAQIIDRDAIASRAYENTVDPLYSIVPPGFPGQVDAFEQKYGEPSMEKARALLQDAGVDTPVQLTLGYTPTHYGPNAVDEATELQRQLNDSGLFEVKLSSTEWEQYQTLYKEGAYDLFQLGWFPDYLDADNYTAPFLVDGGFYANGYQSQQANKLVSQERSTDNQQRRQQIFTKLQELVAEDVPLIPSWVGKNIAVVGQGVSGIEETLDPAFIMRFWMISKSS